MKARIAGEVPNNTTTEMGRTVKLLKLRFKTQPSARAFFDNLIELLPLRNSEYPKIDDNIIQLTDEQHFFYTRYTMAKAADLTPEYLEDSFLKTLRADEFDFSYAFILGIVPGEQGAKRHQNLRPTSRKPFTITPQGGVVSRHEKQPMYTAEEKQGFSQIQSCTLIDTKTLTPAFGFFKERDSKLYGLMTHIEDTLINRMLIDDGGTVSRPFDHESSRNAKMMSLQMKLTLRGQSHYSPDEMRKFKAKNIQSRLKSSRTNEVLARLRFNPYRSVVSICSDTLEARLLAYDFAGELLEHFRVHTESNGAQLNPTYKIPIIFYVKKLIEDSPQMSRKKASGTGNSQHQMRAYTTEMRQQDEKEASRIYNDPTLRAEHYQKNNYEFLLGLPTLTPEILLEPINNTPLALIMMRNSNVRMLMRLFRNSRQQAAVLCHSTQPILSDAVFDALLAQRCIEQNDSIIAKLIMVEVFDLADKVIRATRSDKTQLRFNNSSLIDQLIRNGNPRQIHYIGLDTIVDQAHNVTSWVSVRLYLKEYPNQDMSLLKKLFLMACNTNKIEVAHLFLEMGVTVENISSKIVDAAIFKKWPFVKLYAEHFKSSENAPSYGYALLGALEDKQLELAKLLLQVGATTAWRDEREHGEYPLLSTVFFAIKHGFNELLPQLIEHENTRQDQFYQTRLRLALDLAYQRRNKRAIKLLEALEEMSESVTLIDPTKIKLSICKLVFEAFSLGQRQIGEQRLIRYCHLFQLLPNDNHRVIDGLRAIVDGYSELIISQPSLQEHKILEVLAEIVVASKDVFFLKLLRDLSIKAQHSAGKHVCSCCYESMIARSVLANLTADNFDLIKDIIHHHSDENERWQGQIDVAFEDAITKEPDAAKAALLIELGPDVSRVPYVPNRAEQHQTILYLALYFAASKFNAKLAQILLNHPCTTESIKDEALIEAIKAKPEPFAQRTLSYVEFLLTHAQFNVTMAHIKLSLEQNPSCLLSLLGAMDKIHYRNSNYRWDFCNIWAYASFTVGVSVWPTSLPFDPADGRSLLTKLLEPSLIRHFTLINLLALLDSALFACCHRKVSLPNLNLAFRDERILGLRSISDNHRDAFRYNRVDCEKYNEILAILNDYCPKVDTLPEEAIIISTFKRILAIFSTLKKGPFSGVFFSSKHHHDNQKTDFSTIIYKYLKDIDRLLANKQNAPMIVDTATDEPTINDSYHFL